MEHEKLQQNCPVPQRRWLHGSPGSARTGGPARAAVVSNREKRIKGSFLFTVVLLSLSGGVAPYSSIQGAGRRPLRDTGRPFQQWGEGEFPRRQAEAHDQALDIMHNLL